MYIEHIHRTNGAAAAQQTERRVQVSYILSDGLSGKASSSSMEKSAVDSSPRNELEAEVIKIFKAKALVGHKIHIKIGAKKLVDWLDPADLDSKQWQMDSLDTFSRSRSWVYRGDSSKSVFVKELSMGGGEECLEPLRRLKPMLSGNGLTRCQARALSTTGTLEVEKMNSPLRQTAG